MRRGGGAKASSGGGASIRLPGFDLRLSLVGGNSHKMGVWSIGEGRSLAVLVSRHVVKAWGGVEILGLGGGRIGWQ